MPVSSFQRSLVISVFLVVFVLCFFTYYLALSLLENSFSYGANLPLYKLPENVSLELPLENAPPPDSLLENQIVLVDGMQGGMYQYFVKFAPQDPGRLLIKAYEITSGDPLSEGRINASPTVIGENPNLNVYSGEFTIYENDWNEFFGARIELWIEPENGSPIRVAEDNFQVEGWMR